ncbi:hypothetical protein Tco_1462336 [Tanacetum coccineum]
MSTLNFFDHFESELVTKTSNLSPNDDKGGTPDRDDSVHQPMTGATTDQPGYDELHFATPFGERNTP